MRRARQIEQTLRPNLVVTLDPLVSSWTRNAVLVTQIGHGHFFPLIHGSSLFPRHKRLGVGEVDNADGHRRGSLEAQLIENLQRRDVHPMEEAQGFKALLNLEDPKYSIEQVAAKVGKSPAYCAARVRLTELAAPVVEAFYAEEIGVGHALLLAKLQAAVYALLVFWQLSY